MTNLSKLIAALRSGTASIEVVREALRHPSIVVRANALESFGRFVRADESLLPELAAAAHDPMNCTRLIGTVTVAHVGIASIIRTGLSSAASAADALINSYPEPERSDLVWYLKSEGLS